MIAYFSMEIGIDPQMPTYSGGLGVLAADAIRSAAELKVPLVAVTLLHRKGTGTASIATTSAACVATRRSSIPPGSRVISPPPENSRCRVSSRMWPPSLPAE